MDKAEKGEEEEDEEEGEGSTMKMMRRREDAGRKDGTDDDKEDGKSGFGDMLSWEVLARLLGQLGAFLGLPWDALGAPLWRASRSALVRLLKTFHSADLGLYGGHCEPFWALVGPSCAVTGPLRLSWGSLGAILGPSSGRTCGPDAFGHGLMKPPNP